MSLKSHRATHVERTAPHVEEDRTVVFEGHRVVDRQPVDTNMSIFLSSPTTDRAHNKQTATWPHYRRSTQMSIHCSASCRTVHAPPRIPWYAGVFGALPLVRLVAAHLPGFNRVPSLLTTGGVVSEIIQRFGGISNRLGQLQSPDTPVCMYA